MAERVINKKWNPERSEGPAFLFDPALIRPTLR
jgi:hypothetical protein